VVAIHSDEQGDSYEDQDQASRRPGSGLRRAPPAEPRLRLSRLTVEQRARRSAFGDRDVLFAIATHTDENREIHMKIKTKVQGGRVPVLDDDVPPRGCG
jgi:hypothetical protein